MPAEMLSVINDENLDVLLNRLVLCMNNRFAFNQSVEDIKTSVSDQSDQIQTLSDQIGDIESVLADIVGVI